MVVIDPIRYKQLIDSLTNIGYKREMKKLLEDFIKIEIQECSVCNSDHTFAFFGCPVCNSYGWEEKND